MRYTILIATLLLAFAIKTKANNDPNKKLLESFVQCEDLKNASEYIFYDSTTVDVKETGLSYVYKHQLTKILNAEAAKNNRQIEIDYDPLSAFVEVISAKIYRKDGTVETLDSSKFIDITAPARMIYWGARKVIINFGKLEPGDVIETLIFRKGFTYALLYEDEDDKFIPPMKGHYYDIIEFWSSKHIGQKVYKMYLPQDKPLQYEFYNGEVEFYTHFPVEMKKEKVNINPHKKVKSQAHLACLRGYIQPENKKIYCWTKKDIKPFKRERNMVSPSDVAPKLLISTTPDWYKKSLWFYGVNENFGSFDVTPEVQKKTDELIKGVTDEMEKISILTHWCAENIRYSGISMGEGEGFTLHKGEMTFRDRCGVCKDKAGMLITMLRAAGFESYAAMTMAGSRIDRIPADQFNHSVTIAKLSNGEWILLDPTWVPGVRELWSSAEQQQGFLMGIPEGADLMYTPISPAENHYWKMKAETELTAEGTLKGKIEIEAEGQSDAMIRRALRGYKSNQEEYIPTVMKRIYPQTKINNCTFPDIENLSKPIAISVEFEIANYAIVADNEMIFTPIAVANPFNDYYNAAELFINTDEEEKKFGFTARCSKLVQIDEKITLPEGYKISSKAEDIATEGKQASFKANFTTEGNKLVFSSEHIMNKRVYNASDWKEFRNALVSRKDFSKSLVLINK